MSIPNFVTVHSHPQSLDTASTPEAFLEREKELDTGAITVTDHGTLGACRKIYDLAKDSGITPILGMEAYFRDDDDDLLKAADVPKNDAGTYANYLKYCHITMHFLDQQAYETGVRLLSKADERAERHGSERKPLFGWKELEELGAQNVTFGSGCLIGMVQRHLLQYDNLEMAEKYYQRMRSICKPGNFLVEVFPHVCDRNWVEGVFLTLEGGETIRYYAGKTLRTDKGEITAENLAKEFKRRPGFHGRLIGVKNRHTWQELEPKLLLKVDKIEDFVMNECRPLAPNGDVQAGCNRVMLHLAKKYGDPVFISDDSHLAYPEDKVVQDVRLAQSGAWRFATSYHRLSTDEVLGYFKTVLNVDEKTVEGWVDNSYAWASRFKDFTFNYPIDLPTKFYEANYSDRVWYKTTAPKDRSVRYTLDLIKKHGRFNPNDAVYRDRLRAEIELLHNNGSIDLLPYFWVDEEVCSLYNEQGLLTGPGRGSAAGILISYLLGITHVDPIKWGLSLERFITLDRIKSGKMPDIDQDLPNRDLLTDPDTGWFKQRFGDCCVQISVDTTLKLKSSAKDVARMVHGRVPDSMEALIKKFLLPPQGITDTDFVMGYKSDDGHWVKGSVEYDQALKVYIKMYPKEWEITKKVLGLVRGRGRHACAFAISNRPIQEFIPLVSVSDVMVTQYTAASVEASGCLKMDFLVINVLNDISNCIKLIQERSNFDAKDQVIDGRLVPKHRILPTKEGARDIWDLPEDQLVFNEIAEGRTETVFQYSTPGAVQWLAQFNYIKSDGNKSIDSIASMAAFTALDRPGPLDAMLTHPDYVGMPDDKKKKHNALVEYARRARGEAPSPDVLGIFDELLPETYGIMCYQEQLQKMYQTLTGCSGSEAEEFRSNVAKKKKAKVDKAYSFFIEKASLKIGEQKAKEAWQGMVSWSNYGFNKSHAHCYAFIGYACAYLKYHHPLEWWCSVLNNAEKNEINERFWRYCGKYVDLPDVKLSGDRYEIHGDRIRAPLNLLHGVGETAHKQICKYRPYSDMQDFCDKIQKHKTDTGVMVEKLKDVVVKDPVTKAKTKTKKTVQVLKLGHNAINNTIVKTLMVSGAMDGLFAKTEPIVDSVGAVIGQRELCVSDYWTAYKAAMKKATGKAIETDDLFDAGPLVRYQMRKAVLPAYGEELAPLIGRIDGLKKEGPHQQMTFMYKGESLRVISATGIERIENVQLLAQPIRFAAIAYVEIARVFTFKKSEETKEACELQLEIGGAVFKFVKWSNRNSNSIPKHFKVPLAGAVVVAILSKYKEGKSITVDDVIIVQNPIKDPKEGTPEKEEA